MADGRFLVIENGRKKQKQAIDQSTGVADANKVIRTGADGTIDSSFLPAGIGDDAKILTASENIDVGDFVNIFDDGGTPSIRKADASNGRQADGFVLTAITAASTGKVFFEGGNNALSGLTVGERYYLDTAGNVTSTPKTAAGEYHQYLGKACAATEITVEMEDAVELC